MKSTIRCVAFLILVALLAPRGVTLAQDSDGSILAWGYGDLGQCDVTLPNTNFTAVAAGGAHSLGLKTDGSIVAWGYNEFGQCDAPSPNTGFLAVSAGFNHSLGLKADGSIVAWGSNGSGQCNVPSPNTGFIAVAAGMWHSLGLKGDGSIVAWGHNALGQCDVPAPNSCFVAVAAGSVHNLALKSDGSIVAWGVSSNGECNVPEPNTSFAAVAAGYEHSLALKTDGSIRAWGIDYGGDCTVPDPNSGFVAIASGYRHNLALKNDGSVVAWGVNDFEQCMVPAPNADITAVSAGMYHSLAIQGVSPVPVYLASFTAERRDGAVLVRWAISQPDAGAVLHLWRQEPGRDRIRLSQTLLSGQDTYDFIDPSSPTGPADYWLQEVTTEGSENWYGPARLGAAAVPSALRLYANSPNPFNPRTTIRFDLPTAGPVRLAVYDVAGRLVRTLVDGDLSPGTHEAVWDGRDLSGRAMASGSYLSRLEAGGAVEAVRMGLLR